ncbi:MAG: M14 family metallopeptidase [Acidobacteria bacterium]|nr:M14 family metallopeptidase [Acidobacteriota bacterium]
MTEREPEDASWLTLFETSGGLDSPGYDETLEYFGRLATASSEARLLPIGKSPQGRPLCVFVAARDGDFTPQAARAHRKLVVLVSNGIHAGEIEGKDASMLFLRELLVSKQTDKAHLLDRLVLLVLPVFNVDGHELRSPHGRPNQDGPRLTGWRTNAANLNLNRDYAKADAPEMRAVLSLFATWQPDFVIDNHATNGADYRYHVTYDLETQQQCDPALAALAKEQLLPYVKGQVEAEGFLTAPYVQLRGPSVESGLVDHPGTPRTSTGYGAARNRLTLLVETHSLKPFENRVRSTKATNEAVFRFLHDHRDLVLARNHEADAATIYRYLHEQEPFPLVLESSAESEPFPFKAWKTRVETSAITGGPVLRYERGEPHDVEVPFFGKAVVKESVVVPLAYLVPRELTQVIEVLTAHGIEHHAAEEAEWHAERYTFESPRFSGFPYEGRQMVDTQVSVRSERLRISPDDVFVPTGQRLLRLIVHLLEPRGPDSFVKWGFFNAFFERKEYAETYVMEPIAVRMKAEDPALAKEFEKALETDERLRSDPGLRLDFFYRRSPYFDRHQNRYPVVRLLYRTS